MTILDASGISKQFGAIAALSNVSIQIEEGEAVGLIGPNGAGKTTFFNVLLGMLTADDGQVMIRGRDVTRLAVHDRARLGIGRTFQRLELFGSMSPRQHLLVAAQARRRPGLVADLLGRGRPTGDEHARADELLELVGLTTVADAPVESLSLGLARMVELGRALMTEPDLLLLDEPSSGLDRAEAATFATVLERVRSTRPTAMLFVEHDLDLVLRVVSRLYVMDAGRMLAEGEPAEVMRSPDVRRAYLGDVGDSDDGSRSGATTDRRAPVAVAANQSAGTVPLLELHAVDASYGEFRSLFDVTCSFRSGAVTALLGSNGAGKTTLARVCSGLLTPTSGRLVYEGVEVNDWAPHRFARHGLVHVPEGRSVLATLTVEENLVLSFRALEGRSAVRDALDRAYELFPRLGERRKQRAGTLSGGEQRMLSLARTFPHPPRMLIADELSLGLAPVIVDEVFETLGRLRAEGTAVVIVEQHAAKALQLADDVVILASGQVAHVGAVTEMGDVLERLVLAGEAAT